jgi:peptidoglycan/LPS O-acetylase OafA/YrhL
MTPYTKAEQIRESGKRINLPMQGARGLFCIFVFVYHVYNSSLGTIPALSSGVSDFLFRPLQYGVELFFGLSGFFIVRTIRRTPSVAHFAWDRATRIYPVLWLSILCVMGVSLAFRLPLPPASGIVFSFLTVPPFYSYHHVNPIAWTLDYEVFFYAYCAICWMLRKQIRWLWPLLVLPAAVTLLVFPRTTLMAVGAVIGMGLADRPRLLWLARYPGFALIAFLFGWHLLVLAYAGGVEKLIVMGQPIARVLLLEAAIVMVSIVGGLALLGISKGHGILSRILSSRPLLYMGTISYSFYLWHIIVMAGVKRVLMAGGLDQRMYSQALFLVASLLIALGISTLSYRLIEVRLTGFLRNLADTWPRWTRDRSETLKPLAYRET